MPWRLTRLLTLLLTLLLILLLAMGKGTEEHFRWRDLSESEMQKWFSDTDRCMLVTNSTSIYPSELRGNECGQFSKGNKKILCAVGMGTNNAPCFGPYSTARPNFHRGIEGYTNFSDKPLIDAFEALISQNTTLVLLGDSTTRQKLQSMECEIRREDSRARTNGKIWGILPCETRYEVYLGGKTMSVVVASIGPNSANCLKNGLGKRGVAGGSFENAAHIVEREMTAHNKSVLVVANSGLWYNDEVLFRSHVPPLLEWLQQVATLGGVKGHKYNHAKHNRVAWHETVAQHWANPENTGYFAKPYVEHQETEWPKDIQHTAVSTFQVPQCCRAISNTSYMADWRNDIVRDLLGERVGGRGGEGGSGSGDRGSKYGNIELFPIAAITRPLADMHTCNPLYKHDCTHYCYTPLMLQPLWHQIRQLALRGPEA
mmetsp:Transcript_13339/g.29213  ORF Transcript_13339/g.29213 Transcript_13339/m.29213 type:complete len:429 (+) Transcript_13339:154-1440(+)